MPHDQQKLYFLDPDREIPSFLPLAIDRSIEFTDRLMPMSPPVIIPMSAKTQRASRSRCTVSARASFILQLCVSSVVANARKDQCVLEAFHPIVSPINIHRKLFVYARARVYVCVYVRTCTGGWACFR